jgi:hypothetical protein
MIISCMTCNFDKLTHKLFHLNQPIYIHLNQQRCFKVFSTHKFISNSLKMRWVLLPVINLNLVYEALDGFHLLVAGDHVKVHFPRCVTNLAELKKIFNKWSHVVLPCYITNRHVYFNIFEFYKSHNY